MHTSAYLCAEDFYKKYCENDIENKKILDVGSLNINGSMKPIFEKGQYVGLDMEMGPNVDVVASANNLPFENESFDIIISSSCFEHDDMFWDTFLEMCRVVKPGGYIYVQAPQNGPYHGHPGDNWRFYKDSWSALSKWAKKNNYDVDLIESYIKDASEPEFIWNDSVGIFKKKDYKKVVCISSFCDTDEKLNLLRNNVKKIKELGLDVICISPFAIDPDIMNSCDYFILTKNNPILEWPTKAIGMWHKININGLEVTLHNTITDYGYAGLNQVKELSQFALQYDYTQFIHIIYDIKIDDLVCKAFKSNSDKSIYRSKRGNDKWEIGLHLMLFSRENLKKLISLITLDSYLENKESDAFYWLYTVSKKLNFTIENKFVEDLIFYFQDRSLFNYSPCQDKFHLFVLKNTESINDVQLLFYNVTDENVIVKVDNQILCKDVRNGQILNLGFKPDQTKTVILECDNIEYNITNTIIKIKHSGFSV
jgi:SAM-dependent methyltransferase